jgi:hypothetical protein
MPAIGQNRLKIDSYGADNKVSNRVDSYVFFRTVCVFSVTSVRLLICAKFDPSSPLGQMASAPTADCSKLANSTMSRFHFVDRFRRQSGSPVRQTDFPKADIDYDLSRVPTTD